LYEKYHSQGFEILAFPSNQFGSQEPGTNEEIKSFVKAQFGVTFPLFSKILVNGPNTEPLWQFLKSAQPGLLGTESIKWNFTKLLCNRQGIPVNRYGTQTNPFQFEEDIVKELNNKMET